MNCKIAALIALMAGAAAPAFAQSAAPAAPAASAYAAPCTRPALEPHPTIPAAKAKAAVVAKATAAYKAWSAPVQPYLACMEKEFHRLDNEINAKSNGAGNQSYNALVDALNKGVDAARAAGVDTTITGVTLVKKGKPCPAIPTVAPAPAIAPATGDAKADKKRLAEAAKAFSAWAGPVYVYIKCMEPQMQAQNAASNAAIAPLLAARSAVSKEHDDVLAQFNAFNDKWTAFARAYNGG